MTARTPGKYGRRRPDHSRPALSFADIAAQTAPAHPASEDYLAALGGGWQILGNDRAGDCNSVTWANMRRLVTTALTGKGYYPSQAQVWQFYRTQNPGFNPNGTADNDGPGSGDDQGMNIQTGLEYLHAHGGPDGVKPVAFAKVNPRDLAEVQAALAIFGCLWLGILVQEANQEEFSQGQPWTDVAGSPIDGGHAVLAGGYTPGVKFITWGTETDLATSFWNGSDPQDGPLVEEAWAVIWPENLGTRAFEEGIGTAALAQAYQELTGKTLPLPPPAPTPPPTPAPAVFPAASANAWLAQHHSGPGVTFASDLRAWMTQSGYPVTK